PSFKPSTLSISCPRAVSMMIGTLFPALRISRHTSSPLIFGSITSSRMSSGASAVARRSPAAPSRASETVYPSYSNPSRSAATIESSSSTIRTFGISHAGFRRAFRHLPRDPFHRVPGGLAPQRQADGERAPLARLALDRHPPAMHLHDVLHDRQPQTAPLDLVHQRRADAVEAVEDLLLLAPRDADAAIADRDNRRVAVARQTHRDLLRLTGVLDRVVEQVVQRLRDGVRI